MPTEPSPTLADFLAGLEQEGELARVKPRVSPVLEITETGGTGGRIKGDKDIFHFFLGLPRGRKVD